MPWKDDIRFVWILIIEWIMLDKTQVPTNQLY